MRILLVAPYFPPDVTGSSNFVADLATALTEAGHAVCVVTPTRPSAEFPFRVITVPSRNVSPGRIAFGYRIPVTISRKSLNVLRRVFEEFRPDIVSVHGQIFDITLLSLIMASRRGIPTTTTVHSAIWHNSKVANFILAAGDFLLAKTILGRRTTRWISVDDRTTQHVRQRYCPDSAVIPICIRRGAFTSGDARRAIEKFGLSSSTTIASIGHVVPVRNRIALVRALPEVIKVVPDLQVVIVGRVADDSFLETAASLGVIQHLRVLGAVPHTDIRDILDLATLEIHDLQGFGLGIGSLEPLDAGVSIVAFVRDNNLPGISLRSYSPETFLDSNEPSIVAKVILKLLTDDEYRGRVLMQQRRILDEIYYSDVVARAYTDEFRKILANP